MKIVFLYKNKIINKGTWVFIKLTIFVKFIQISSRCTLPMYLSNLSTLSIQGFSTSYGKGNQLKNDQF